MRLKDIIATKYPLGQKSRVKMVQRKQNATYHKTDWQ